MATAIGLLLPHIPEVTLRSAHSSLNTSVEQCTSPNLIHVGKLQQEVCLQARSTFLGSSFSLAVSVKDGVLAYPEGQLGRSFIVYAAKSTSKKSSGGAAGGGFGAKPATPKVKPVIVVDAAALLRKSELLYVKLLEEHFDQKGVREFVMCVRQKAGGGPSAGRQTDRLMDWVPVAELAVRTEVESAVAIKLALSSVCRKGPVMRSRLAAPSTDWADAGRAGQGRAGQGSVSLGGAGEPCDAPARPCFYRLQLASKIVKPQASVGGQGAGRGGGLGREDKSHSSLSWRRMGSNQAYPVGSGGGYAELSCAGAEQAAHAPAARVRQRELAECAVRGAKTLQQVPREQLEYAYESIDSFYTHVVGQASEVSTGAGEECPYAILGLTRGADSAEVRTAYRALAAAHHPDRHINGNQLEAEEQFKKVKEAYEVIRSTGLEGAAALGSNYAAIGGNQREGLSEPLSLAGIKPGGSLPAGMQVAVRPLNPDLVQRFLLLSRMQNMQGTTPVGAPA
eukprot:jgi/Mesen1/1609/ME000134S00724